MNYNKVTNLIRCLSKSVSSKFFVTTPIYYVNADPHIGHLYSSVIADASQRWHYLLSNKIDIKFSTGCDEHGLKIQQAAHKNNTNVIEYCKKISDKYRKLSNDFHINCTDFIRTTDETHKETVHKFWNVLNANGFIYTNKYKGWYCLSDETFLSESQLKEVTIPSSNGQKSRLVSAESGHSVEWTEEDNYLFRLSSLKDDLKYWIQRNENAIKPKKFSKILLDTLLSESLLDISISRPSSRVHWGIQVPNDKTQTIYVWLDALVNYLTVAGYSHNPEMFNKYWPPDLQVVGKDILKFHGIYWPAFLMAAKLELPKSILCHSHWTVNGEKMSKSKNNVICPFSLSELYTFDGLRYFLLREGVAHSDGNYSDKKLIRYLNSELADTFGNLLSRCCGITLNPNQIFPEIEPTSFHYLTKRDVTKNLIENLETLPDICMEHYNECNFYKVVDNVIACLHKANLFFETMKPWQMEKNDLNNVLHVTMETLRICGILLQPIIPTITVNLLDKLNVPINERFFQNTKHLSWNSNYQMTSLKSPNVKSILFKRILFENNQVKKINV